MQILIRKPFHHIKEHHEGEMFPDAILMFGRVPHIMHVEYVGNQAVNFPIQYRHYFRLDLWFVVFEHKWLSKEIKTNDQEETKTT